MAGANTEQSTIFLHHSIAECSWPLRSSGTLIPALPRSQRKSITNLDVSKGLHQRNDYEIVGSGESEQFGHLLHSVVRELGWGGHVGRAADRPDESIITLVEKTDGCQSNSLNKDEINNRVEVQARPR